MLERFATLGMLTFLSVVLGPVVAAEAQEPSGYWLYVGGTWKAGFIRRADCETAGAKAGSPYECRPVQVGSQTTGDPGDKWAADVKHCGYLTGADAYVSGPDRLQVLGTEPKKFAFTK
jgi:hypothetical protein